MKIKSIILPLFAVFAFAVLPVAVADERDDYYHKRYSEYPLIHATYHGDIAEVKRLLDGGANPNVINKNNYTALMLLQAYDDDEEIVKLLLSAGANPNAVNNNGNTALARTYNTEIVKMLLAAGANPNLSRTPALIYAMGNRDSLSERVKMLLAAGADVHAVNGGGETALIRAARNGGAEVVKILISAGANTNAADNNGKTALMEAKWYRRAETIAALQNFRPSVSPEEYIAGLQAEYCGDIATIECQEDYISPEEPAEELAEEPAEPETKTVCRSFANGINPDNTEWGRIGASEAGVGETEYAAIRAAIRICENDGLTECQTDLEVKCEEVAAE